MTCLAFIYQDLLFSWKRAPLLSEGSSSQPPAHLVCDGAAEEGRARQGQGKYPTLTQYQLDRAARQETAKFSPSGSCSTEDLRPGYGDELGQFALL